MNQYFFEDIRILVNHLIALKPGISPIKLQKSLYFLFAFYGATYGSMNRENSDEIRIETEATYPQYLFPNKFSAWKYGPVVEDVYKEFKNNNYEPQLITETEHEYDLDVVLYLEELFKQIDATSDFTLVERSHMDNAWKEVYDQSGGFNNSGMNHDSIVREYQEKFIK